MKLFTLVLLASTAFSCGDDDETPLRYTGHIPRFSVDPLPNSGTITRSRPSEGPFWENLLIKRAHAQEARIDCGPQLERSNRAPDLSSGVADIAAKGVPLTYRGMVQAFYAQALFFDCHMRKKVQEVGVDETGTPPTYTYQSDSELLYWTDPEGDVPGAAKIKGRLVTRRNQSNNINMRFRVDLFDQDSGNKEISTLLKIEDGPRAFYIQANVKRIGPDTQKKDLISGRFWQKEKEGNRDTYNLLLFEAIAQSGANLSIRAYKCDGQANKGSDCTSSKVLVAYDSSGDVATAPQETMFSSGSLSGESFLANGFFTGSEDEYFSVEGRP